MGLENLPTTVFVHAVTQVRSGVAHAYLLAAIICTNMIKNLVWQPSTDSLVDTLYITCGTSTIYQWRIRADLDSATFVQDAQAVPVPAGAFNPPLQPVFASSSFPHLNFFSWAFCD